MAPHHAGLGRRGSNEEYAGRNLIIPHAALALPLAVLPLGRGALVAWRRTTRRQRGDARLCASCGYDLRATPDRCPECGATP